MSEKNIKSFIDELIKEVEDELDEANVTGNVDGYDTPNAFSGKNSDKKRKKTATQFGYTLVNNDINNIDESVITEKQFKGLEGIPANKSLEKIGKTEKLNIIKGKGNIIGFIVPDEYKGKRNFWQVISTGNIKKSSSGNIVMLMGQGPMNSPSFKTIDDLIDGVDWKSMEETRRFNESVNEASLQKGKTYGGSKCEGGCFIGKEGLKKIIKISKDSPKDVFMFRDDNYSGLQPHFIKDGVIAKATVINPAYDLEKHKVSNLKIGNDVILSVRLFVSTNESVNEVLDPKAQKFLDAIQVNDRSIKDLKNITVDATPQGNWSVYYKGKRMFTLNGKMLDDKTIMKYGLEHMDESLSEGKKIQRPVNRWLELKNDESMHANKKLATGLRELKYQLKEVETFFRWYNQIKTMNELSSDTFWKRTHGHIYKIKERLINIAKTIQEIEK